MPFKIEEPDQNQVTQKDEQEIIIGIDLGTTNSLAAIIKNDNIELLGDDNGQNIIPSIVSLDDNADIVKVGVATSGYTNISSVKRLMGKSYDDVKNYNLDYKISPKNGLTIEVADKNYRPEEISAAILRHLKKISEHNLKAKINKCVLTVPAYFDEAAKNATKHAAKLAGLEVARLLNEPTAAALAYGLDNKSEGLYMVYDLGGGTFDVSLLRMQQGVFKVLGVLGDNELGGDDLDQIIVDNFPNLTKRQARKIKESFSSQKTLKIDGKDFSDLEFANLIGDKINKTIDLVQSLLDDLEIDNDDVSGVILVGGSTRLGLVQEKLANIFGKEKILTNLDPDRVVAIGAAWQAYNLSGRGQNLLLDVVPLSLGIEMIGGIVDKIINRNITTPCAYAKEFTTYADNQTGMKLHIVQGERELAVNCRSLANFEIKGIPPMKAGMAKILVTFTVDADGLLTVTAQEQATKQMQEIVIKPTYSLDESAVKNMLLDSLKNSKSDIRKRLLIESINIAQKDISIIKSDLQKSPDLVNAKEKKDIEQKIIEIEGAISQNPDKDKIEQLVEDFHKITENLVLKKVNKVLNSKISGTKISDLDS